MSSVLLAAALSVFVAIMALKIRYGVSQLHCQRKAPIEVSGPRSCYAATN